MTSRLRAALIFSVVLALMLPRFTAAGVIRSVRYTGFDAVPSSDLSGRSLLRAGVEYSDSLVSQEVARIDSLYFLYGFVRMPIGVDTVAAPNGVEVRFAAREGEPATIGTVSISGAELIGEDKARKLVRPGTGDRFNPILLEESLRVAPAADTREYLRRIRLADAKMQWLVKPAGRCLWGDETARQEGWTAKKNWWYFSRPVNAGEELTAEFEED